MARWRAVWVIGGLLLLLGACGGSGGGTTSPPAPPPAPDARLAWGDAGFQTVLHAVPTPPGTDQPTTLTVHYRRPAGDYAGWQLHAWGAAKDPGWNAGHEPSGRDDFGAVFQVPLVAASGEAGYLFHKGDQKDHGGADQKLALQPGRNEVWRVQDDPVTYGANPLAGPPQPLGSVSASDARAYWLSRALIQWPGIRAASGQRFRLLHSARGQVIVRAGEAPTGMDEALTLDVSVTPVPAALAERFKFIGAGVVLALPVADQAALPSLLTGQLVLLQEDAAGRVLNATTAQLPGVLDDLYAAAETVDELGVRVADGATRFRLWAPTAQKVLVFTHETLTGPAVSVDDAVRDAATGVWSASRAGDLGGRSYRYAVEVFVPGVGVVRNLVTDPYSVSLTADSQRSVVLNLDSPALKPAGWDASTPPATVAAAPDMVIYELHVRDFSANDASVSAANRGKYAAFAERDSNGMRHLAALARAGLTDVHLLPVFDIASVPESGCVTPSPAGAPDASTQQAAVAASAARDCFNWGYDPWHYNAPEGSYASDAADGAVRVREFRGMVQALHAAGLRVGMDVVYNHTTASGQRDKSVLDRIVPGYYHRLDAAGRVETSTCCDNTATEHRMMARLMIDSVIGWARDYKVSSFRFDVMGHQPRAVMEALQARVNAAAGRPVQLLGEGWNFGEVADGRRFVQASQWSLNGSGIGTFSHFARDAVRGGGPFDGGTALLANQGFVNGLHYDPNAAAPARSSTDLMWQADIVKAGLAGSIRRYALTTHWDATLPLEQLLVNNQPAGYVTQPSEVVNYVENHDNQTLFDNNAFKLPAGTSREDRARVQLLGAAINAFSQGIAYFHAGVDTLRSKSLDRNSYDAGDWFNRLDWRYQDNYFGIGLPRQGDNGDNWSVMRPLLADAASIRPQPGDIAWMRDAFRDLLAIRRSTTLLRLRTADDIVARLRFHNTGSAQVPTVLAGHVDGRGYAGAGFAELLYLINVDKQPQAVTIDVLKGKAFELHPAQAAATAADRRVANDARYDAPSGRFSLPARSAAVFVVR